jgi:hypothetical protein
MPTRLFSLFLLAALVLNAAAKKTAGSGRGENQDLILEITIHTDPAEIKQMLGSDLDGHYLVAEIKAEPKYGKEVAVDRDDFVLRTDKDGERTKPFVPSQIVGGTALVISQKEGQRRGGGVMLGGGYPDGYPGDYPYPGGYPPMGVPPVMTPEIGVGGDEGGGDSDTKATMKKGDSDKASPLQKSMEEKMLANRKTDKPVSGLLYFPMEKQKLKDLELLYGGRENRISLKFK